MTLGTDDRPQGFDAPAVSDAEGGSPRPRDVRRARLILGVAWLAAMILGVGGGALSLALFTRTVPLSEPLAAGTISLDVTPTDALLALDGMVPGDQVSAVVTVLNDGTDDLRYAMTVAATDPDGRHLADALQLAIERRAAGCGGALLETVFTGTLAAGAVGDPLPGANAGDRPLASGVAESICVRVTLPIGADILYADASTTATLTFHGEQTAGNP